MNRDGIRFGRLGHDDDQVRILQERRNRIVRIAAAPRPVARQQDVPGVREGLGRARVVAQQLFREASEHAFGLALKNGTVVDLEGIALEVAPELVDGGLQTVFDKGAFELLSDNGLDWNVQGTVLKDVQ